MQKRSIRLGWAHFAVEGGQAVLETALVSVVLLLLFAGTMDVGRMFYSYIVITNAAREGARAAVRVACDDNDPSPVGSAVVAAVEHETSSLPEDPPGDVDIVITPDPSEGCFAPGSPVTVEVLYQYTNLLTAITGSEEFFTMSNFAVMAAGGLDVAEE